MLLELGQLEDRGAEGDNIDLRIWNKVLYEHFMFSNLPIPIKSAVYEIMWINTIDPGGQQVTIHTVYALCMLDG